MRKHQDTIFNVVLLFIIMVVVKLLLFTESPQPVYSALQATNSPVPTATMTLTYAQTPTPIPTTTAPATFSVIDNGGGYISLALDNGGIPVIGYSGVGGIRVARCNNNTICNTPNIVPFNTGLVFWASLALDAGGIPVLSYMLDRDLWLARCNSIACDAPTFTLVDSAGDTGSRSSLALDSGGIPVISYFDITNNDLKLARCNNNTNCDTPTITTVDSAGFVGIRSSLALDSGGIPIISYIDSTNNQLKLARCNNNTNCDNPAIVTIGSAGNAQTSLALDSGGIPVMSYYDAAGHDLRVARCNNNTTCNAPVMRTIDADIALFGVDSSLELYSGIPVIGYHVVDDYDLKLAWCNNNTTCDSPTTMMLSSMGVVGTYPSLAIDGGAPVISYRDDYEPNLMLYRGLPIRLADISIMQTDVPDPTNVGSNLTYIFNVTNFGPDNATNVTLADMLPANTTFVSATTSQGTCLHNAGQVSCNLGNLSNAASASVTIEVVPIATGQIANSVNVSASESDPNGSNNASLVTTTIVPAGVFTATFTPTPTMSYTPTNTYTPSNTPTPLTPTATLTSTPLDAPPDYVPLPTLTPSETLTPTDVPPPSATPTATEMAFLLPTATATHTPPPSPPPYIP